MNSNLLENKDAEEITIACKKRKFLKESESGVKKKANTEDASTEAIVPADLKPMETSADAIRIVPVVADEYLRPVETEKMYVGKIIDKKETSRLIRELSSVWPIGSHLKRVRWTEQKGVFEILLCPASGKEEEGCDLGELIVGRPVDPRGMSGEVRVGQVATRPPHTNAQYRQAMAHWPVHFRENKYVERVLSGDLFGFEERREIARFMRLCQQPQLHGDEEGVGCVIVDPACGRVVATAHDLRHQHPLQHALMVATDLVAHAQGGGAWSNILHSPRVSYQLPCPSVDPKDSDPKDKKNLPYLCTGYDAYVSREPCVMCGMALVHSRIRRVFYGEAVPWGALGSHGKLHLLQGLNHHYEAFRVSFS